MIGAVGWAEVMGGFTAGLSIPTTSPRPVQNDRFRGVHRRQRHSRQDLCKTRVRNQSGASTLSAVLGLFLVVSRGRTAGQA
jgi:hypothetical protein